MLVVRGLFRVYMTSPEGRQVTVRYARAADVLGIAVLVGGPANVSVQALAAWSLFRISSRTLTGAARRDARVAWALAEELNRRLYETLQQTAVNTFGSVRQRVAAHLLVGFQNSATGLDLGFYAARSYSLMRPPRTGRRLIRSWERSATGWSGRGGRSWRLRCGRRPL